MKRRKFIIYAGVIGAIAGGMASYAVVSKNILLFLISIVAGIILLNAGKMRVDEVIEDERIYRTGDRASRKALQIFGVSTAFTGIALITMNEYVEAGYALAISSCILMILYIFLYTYYARKGIG